ncbi:histidinol-phosphate transaminase [Colwellia sp. D2M02]|uniref:histidinol-phosphate transaminase n=1 Tax=Colwellia sp. D2M02 TaxID=2841562 RepID=UPI001C092F2F|nr:histidinol-phosphate transaminase [Colwellia sp. D2M02]MBU2891964.1 histidinol-phosphate transaminase [Colwellia sp. D2M02]
MSNNNATPLSIADKLARPELVDMVPYQSARRLFASGDTSQTGNNAAEQKIWLNANEASGRGEYQLSAENINRYPDFQPTSLLNAYSNYCNLAKEQILATRGADEGIELIIRSFCRAYQDSILICPPTYGMYAISAENHGAGIISVPLVNNTLNLAALAEQVGQVKVVFLCSPGNPTGNILPREQILAAIDLFQGSAMVVIDEAYIEFCSEQSTTKLLADFDNVIILRTLSKAFALAGLRCGFTLANESVITLLSKVIAPYPISAPVAELASKALTDDIALMKAHVEQVNHLRASLSAWLITQPWCSEVFASDANFVLFRCTSQAEKTRLFELLVANNLLIRDQSKQAQLENCLRISIGSEHEINQLQQLLSAS